MSESADPEEPIRPGEPTRPDGPTQSDELIRPDEPVQPDEPIESGGPIRPDEPTQPLEGWTPPSGGSQRPAPQASSAGPQFPPPQRPAGAHRQPGEHLPLAQDDVRAPWGPPPQPQPYWQPPPGAVPPQRGTHTRRQGLSAAGVLGVATLALVIGLVGGLAGGAVWTEFVASDSGSSRTSSAGLDSRPTRESAPLPAANGSVEAVAEELLPSTVQILAGGEGLGGATGSGFVLDADGHVVTNNHVVEGAAADSASLLVIGHDGRRREATIVGRSPVYDLAVLRISRADGLVPAALGEPGSLRVGEAVVAFGAPLGLSQTVTSGIVSALNRPVSTGDRDNESSYINAVQTDAAINPGNSGGPLVNLAGEVIGVNSAIATTGASGESGNIGVGFAIPIAQVRTTADQILRTGEAEYPVIGAQVRTGGGDGQGAVLLEVESGTPAYDGGLRSGDVVTAVAGHAVTDGIAMIVAIRTHQPGDSIEMTYLRDGDEGTAEVVLDGEVG